MRARVGVMAGGVAIVAALGCGDRAPPAVWPEPQPPSVARPIDAEPEAAEAPAEARPKPTPSTPARPEAATDAPAER